MYSELLKSNDNVLAIYTAHHTSWVVPEDVRSHRRVRSLLAATDVANNTGLLYNTTEIMLFVNTTASYHNGSVV